jgi:hypothetical protein
VTTTLLRKAGYRHDEVFDMCDGGHCYNVVRLPGDEQYHLVDTDVGNIRLDGLPSGHPYCRHFAGDDEERIWLLNDHYFFHPEEAILARDLYRANQIVGCHYAGE